MKFSIIIPNYNYDRFIRQAIESALAVDWPDLEVIIVDDGSTDNSREVIESFGDKVIAIFQPNRTQLIGGRWPAARTQRSPPFSDTHKCPVVEPIANCAPLSSIASAWRYTRS